MEQGYEEQSIVPGGFEVILDLMILVLKNIFTMEMGY